MTTVQNHLHLDEVGTIDGDNAPTKTYKAKSRLPMPSVQTLVTTSFTGSRHRSTVVDVSDTPILHHDFRYRIRVTEDEYLTLLGLLGKTLSLVDNYHPDTGSDHSAYVKSVAFVKINDIKGVNALHELLELNIELVEL